ncbi:GNAT family N-acetyltransferase [Roseivivax sp. CAU 1753]
MRVRTVQGDARAAALDGVAALRIALFREFPYLYDGDAAYERAYLQPYIDSRDAVVIGAYDGDRLVGAATGTPMEDHAEAFAAAFANTGHDLSTMFYCAESLLLPEYRGQRIGHLFFDMREEHARALGRTQSCFCSVLRPETHPLRPADYRSHTAFWRQRGYVPLPGVVASFRWKDVDQDTETQHDMQFWAREL